MFCCKCGNPVDADARFCCVCGTPVEREQTQPVYRVYMSTEGASLVNYKFVVRDAQGNVRYTAATVSEAMFTHHARLYYTNGAEALQVHQQKKMTLAAMNFDLVTPDGRHITEVLQKNKLTKYVYEMPQIGLVADGDFVSHNFTYTRNGQTVAKVSMKWLSPLKPQR